MNEATFHRTEPKILYFGTPVVLISSLNENGEKKNLAPMSSFWAQGWTVDAVLARRDENRGQHAAPSGMRRDLPAPENVAAGGEARAAHRQKSSARTQGKAISF